jgi:hypothetical protein
MDARAIPPAAAASAMGPPRLGGDVVPFGPWQPAKRPWPSGEWLGDARGGEPGGRWGKDRMGFDECLACPALRWMGLAISLDAGGQPPWSPNHLDVERGAAGRVVTIVPGPQVDGGFSMGSLDASPARIWDRWGGHKPRWKASRRTIENLWQHWIQSIETYVDFENQFCTLSAR